MFTSICFTSMLNDRINKQPHQAASSWPWVWLACSWGWGWRGGPGNTCRVLFLSSILLVSGDILLNVNGIDLTGVSRSEAVALLKNTNSSVVLKALEMRACEAQEERGHPPPPEAMQATSESSEWSPSWVMWLGLPR